MLRHMKQSVVDLDDVGRHHSTLYRRGCAGPVSIYPGRDIRIPAGPTDRGHQTTRRRANQLIVIRTCTTAEPLKG